MLNTQGVASLEADSELYTEAARIAPIIAALEDNEIDILEMKAAGDSDETIAEHTGLPKASIKNIYARLCAQLGLPHHSCSDIITLAKPLIAAQEDLKKDAEVKARTAKAEQEYTPTAIAKAGAPTLNKRFTPESLACLDKVKVDRVASLLWSDPLKYDGREYVKGLIAGHTTQQIAESLELSLQYLYHKISKMCLSHAVPRFPSGKYDLRYLVAGYKQYEQRQK